MLDAAFFPEFDETTDPETILGWINDSVETVKFEALDAAVFSADAGVRIDRDQPRKWSTFPCGRSDVSRDFAPNDTLPTCMIHRISDPMLAQDLRSVLVETGYDACLRAQTRCGEQQHCRVDLFIGQMNEHAFLKCKAQILSALLATIRMIEQGCLRTKSNAIGCSLSSRESEVLTWTAEGKTTWETAQILSLSESTINFHLRRAMKKLGAANKCNAAAMAISQGMISLRQ